MRRYAKRNGRYIFSFLVSNLLAAVSSVLLAYLLGAFTDAAIGSLKTDLMSLAIITLLYIILDTFLNYLMDYTKERAICQIGKSLRSDVVRRIEMLSNDEKQRHEDSFFLSLIDNDIPAVEQDYFGSLGSVFFQICCFGIAILSAISISPIMTVIMLFVSLIPIMFPKLSEKPLQKAKAEEQEAKKTHLHIVAQILNGYSFLKIFNGFFGIGQIYDQENDRLLRKKKQFGRMRAILYAGSFGAGNLVFLCTWVVGIFFVTKQYITLPELIIFSQLMTFVAGPIQIISERYTALTAASAVCDKLTRFLDDTATEEIYWGEKELTDVNEIALRNVSVRTKEKLLLCDVNITFHKGDRIAVLGESGSGKSTLIRYLAALTSGDGAYLLNGLPIRSYAYRDFRQKISLLEQRSFVFDASIRDNLTMFDSRYSDREKLTKALSDVGLGQWYGNQKDSLETRIGTGEAGMSGGEERRLNLCRALVRNSDVMILDEPETGLDTETRRFVEKAIADMQCSILIAAVHEFSPEFLKTFNRVLTVKDGKVYEKITG